MTTTNIELPTTPNYGVSPAEKARDWPGMSFVRKCWKCKMHYFGQRNSNTCRSCDELLESIS